MATGAFTNLMLKLHKRLSGRKPMNTQKKKRKRGPAGESRDYKVNPNSDIGKAQKRNRTQADQLYQLDQEEKAAARRRRQAAD